MIEFLPAILSAAAPMIGGAGRRRVERAQYDAARPGMEDRSNVAGRRRSIGAGIFEASGLYNNVQRQKAGAPPPVPGFAPSSNTMTDIAQGMQGAADHFPQGAGPQEPFDMKTFEEYMAQHGGGVAGPPSDQIQGGRTELDAMIEELLNGQRPNSGVLR